MWLGLGRLTSMGSLKPSHALSYGSGGLVNWLIVADQASSLEQLEEQDEYRKTCICLKALESTKIARIQEAEVPKKKVQKVRLTL